MSESTSVPHLDLAPKLNRPLRLWWPPDYLRLLYWAFFFPQAIRWYAVDSSSQKTSRFNTLSDIRRPAKFIPRIVGHAFQGFMVVFLVVGASAWATRIFGLPVTWQEVMLGAGWGMVIGMLLGSLGGWAGSIALGIVFGIANGIGVQIVLKVIPATVQNAVLGAWLGLCLNMTFTIVERKVGAVIRVLLVSLLLGILGGFATGVVISARYGLVAGIAAGIGGFLFVAVGGMSLSSGAFSQGGTVFAWSDDWWVISFVFGIPLYVWSIVTLGWMGTLLFAVMVWRLPDWLVSMVSMRSRKHVGCVSRLTQLPIPGLQKLISAMLKQNWRLGLRTVNQTLLYSRQWIVAGQALKKNLTATSDDDLLEHVVVLVEEITDWNVLDTVGEDRDAALAACAGFWYWRNNEAAQASRMFANIKDLRHGVEVHGIAQALVEGKLALNLPQLAAWEEDVSWLDILPDSELRPGTLQCLRMLRTAASEASLSLNTLSILNRSTALNRASAVLAHLIESGSEICFQPEWPLVKQIATQWRDIIAKAGGVIGEEVLRQPGLNPYEGYSGLPVTGPIFVGRENILRHIEDRWVGGAQPPPLILFGHRRMGKSSVLRNLGRIAGVHTIVVYLDMQDAGWVEHTGQLLQEFAEAIHRRAVEVGLDAGPIPTEVGYADHGTARRSLNALLDRLDAQMTGRRLILAVDEYEIIETGIEMERIDAGVPGYLRSKAAQYRWLGLIFAGLHTLDEMGRDYRSAFYGQAEHIRVGYLSHDNAIHLITQPHPDFALEYAPDLREELYRLTYGQPYLLQRLCWELVNNWNERFLRDGESTLRTLTMDDLASVLTPDFYQAGGYYFDGVWSNVTDSERQLMRVMAGRAEGTWTPAELVTAVSLPEAVVRASLELLRRHDVIVDEAGGIRFAAELMRRWVAKSGGEV